MGRCAWLAFGSAEVGCLSGVFWNGIMFGAIGAGEIKIPIQCRGTFCIRWNILVREIQTHWKGALCLEDSIPRVIDRAKRQRVPVMVPTGREILIHIKRILPGSDLVSLVLSIVSSVQCMAEFT